MADQSLQTFTPDDYAEDVGQFTVDFSQLATTGTITVVDQLPVLSNADVAGVTGGDPIEGVLESVDTTAVTPYGLGTAVISDIDTTTGDPPAAGTDSYPTTYTADILGINSAGQILVGVEPYVSATDGDPYQGQYAILSDTSLDESGVPVSEYGTTTDLTFTNPSADLPCFAAGTRIGTGTGDVAGEAIAAGDIVRTISGVLRPVVWVGHRTVDISRHPRPELVRPILIEAGAVADAAPARDLVVSPDHALFVDGVLIPAKYLVNDVTIRVLDVPSITYHHIELAEHDVVLAENLPAETFLDTGNRDNFAGSPVVAAHPDFGTACDLVFHTWEARGYAPLVLAGPPVDRVRARIALRRSLPDQCAQPASRAA
jgi:hypothetical protein